MPELDEETADASAAHVTRNTRTKRKKKPRKSRGYLKFRTILDGSEFSVGAKRGIEFRIASSSQRHSEKNAPISAPSSKPFTRLNQPRAFQEESGSMKSSPSVILASAPLPACAEHGTCRLRIASSWTNPHPSQLTMSATQFEQRRQPVDHPTKCRCRP